MTRRPYLNLKLRLRLIVATFKRKFHTSAPVDFMGSPLAFSAKFQTIHA
jgi:hypothetical protein